MQEKFTALFQIDGFAFHNRHPVYKLRLNGYAYIGAEASRTYLLVAFLVTYLPIYLFTYLPIYLFTYYLLPVARRGI